MTEERVTCFGYPFIRWQDTEISRLYGCNNPAKFEIGGKHYCGVHRHKAERLVSRLARQIERQRREALQQDIYQFVRDFAGGEIPFAELEAQAEELVKRMDGQT